MLLSSVQWRTLFELLCFSTSIKLQMKKNVFLYPIEEITALNIVLSHGMEEK